MRPLDAFLNSAIRSLAMKQAGARLFLGGLNPFGPRPIRQLPAQGRQGNQVPIFKGPTRLITGRQLWKKSLYAAPFTRYAAR